MTVTKSINVDLIKARINELQSDIERVKSDLQSLKGSVVGNAGAEDFEKIDRLTRELLTLKAGQSELVALIQTGL